MRRYRGRVVSRDIHKANLHMARRRSWWRYICCWWEEKTHGYLP
jgi:hypothetical protein